MSKQKRVILKLAPCAALVAAALGIGLPAHAATWSLADTPLYLGNSIPANLLFLVDDSGSMDWDSMTKDYTNDGLFTNSQPDGTSTGTDGGITNRAGCSVGGTGQTFTGYPYATQFAGNKYNGSCNIAADTEWRFRNADFNPLYFNPLKEYKPWSGTDKNGIVFGNVNPTQAWKDPYTKNYSGGGEWIDLTTKGAATSSSGAGDSHVALAGGMRFYTWVDSGNKKFDNANRGDTVTEYAIGSLILAQVQPTWFGFTAADPVAAVKTNFANWFSYYRARHLVAKGALGNLAGNVNNMRIGLGTIHNNAGVNTSVSQIDTTAAGQANRLNLMNNLYRIDPGSGTPLLNAFKQVGKYLAGQSNSHFPASSAAPLPVSQGGECQQNFTLVMTDGFYNGIYNDNTPTVGDADGDKSSAFDNKNFPVSPQTYPLYNDPVPVTKTMADIAMYYYEGDILPLVANKVPVNPGVDENKAQHMVTFAIAFGVSGDLKGMPDDYPAHKPPATDAATWNNGVFPGWPNPSSSIKTSDNFSNKQKIDDLRHAAYNGRGEFLSAQNPDELVSSLESMLATIQKRTSASAGLAFNSTTVRTTTLVFQGRYVTSDWVGNLHYLPVLQDGSVGVELVETAKELKKLTPTTRTIITYDYDLGAAVPFRWASLGASWKTELSSSYVLDYLRGDHTCEVASLATCGGTKSYRNRSWEMGDIINSAPAYVGTPSAIYDSASPPTSFSSGYGGYKLTQASRTPMVYVGANDGMLHGFDASINSDGTKTATTGKELLAYIPGTLRKKMRKLSDPAYATAHKYYVDGSPTTGDVEFGGAWHTALVSGLRAGGQAMFALDVTNPGTFSEATASSTQLWEFNDVTGPKGDADLGYTFSEPGIARLADGSWAAIFGNGYNSTEADGNVGSGNAVLYVVNIQTGAVIKKLDTLTGPLKDPACMPGCTLATGRPNGLSGVTVVDVDGDDKADFVYAGDLFGNMWRFDISAGSSASWIVSFSGKPLFAARSKEGLTQSITVRPAFGAHISGDGYMVYFGTGKYFENGDNTSTGQPTQDFYAVWDKWPKGTSTAFTAFTRTDLVMQEILSETGNTRVNTDNPVTTQQGWYLDLVLKGAASNQGERVVTEPILGSNGIVFTTLIPATAICEFGGTGWLMILDNNTGGKLPSSPVDTNNDGKFDKNDVIVSGLKSENGIPSAPALISGGGGTVDLIAMNFSNGSVGGTGFNEPTPAASSCFECPDDAPAPTPFDQFRPSGLKGRLSWERIR